MKIAVAADGTQVSPHFGRCEAYLVATVDEGKVASTTTVANPGHEPGRLPGLMRELGVECLVVGGIGPRAVEMLGEMGIAVKSGASGSLQSVLDRFLAGELEGEGNACDH